MSPRFAIITLTYNRPAGLVTTIRSVLAQTYPHWLHIICNDGSTVDYEPAMPWIKHPQIIYLPMERNRGGNVARNAALDRASELGVDYVVFLDDEDEFVPRCLEVAVEKIAQHPEVGWFLSNTFGDAKPSNRRIVREGYYDWIDDYSYGKTLRGDKTNVIAMKVLRELRCDGRYHSDNLWPFLLRLAARTKIWGYTFDSASKVYSEGGITKTSTRYPRTWLEIYSRFARHALAIRIRPTKLKAYFGLLAELVKTPKRALLLITGRVKPRPSTSSGTGKVSDKAVAQPPE